MNFLLRLLLSLFVFAGTSAHANQTSQGPAAPDGLTGAWWDAQRSGQGLVIEQVAFPEPGRPDQLHLYWFTYADDGSPLYLVGAGEYRNGFAFVDVIRTQGGRHGRDLDPTTVQRTPWGVVRIEGISCERIRVSYTPEGGSGAELEMARLATTLGGATAQGSCDMRELELGVPKVEKLETDASQPFWGDVVIPYRMDVRLRPPAPNREHELARYRITAVDGDVVVGYVWWSYLANGYRPYWVGLKRGETISEGSALEISLRAPLGAPPWMHMTYRIGLNYRGHQGSNTSYTVWENISWNMF